MIFLLELFKMNLVSLAKQESKWLSHMETHGGFIRNINLVAHSHCLEFED